MACQKLRQARHPFQIAGSRPQLRQIVQAGVKRNHLHGTAVNKLTIARKERDDGFDGLIRRLPVRWGSALPPTATTPGPSRNASITVSPVASVRACAKSTGE